MNDRQWINAALDRRPAPVPYNFMASPKAIAKLEQHYGTTDLAEALRLPIRMSAPWTIKPLYASPAKFGPRITDEFGVVWTTSEIDRGVPIGPPLREASLDGYRFPDPAAPSRFAHLAQWTAGNREHFTMLWVGDLWERAAFMRGLEELCMDVVLEQAFVHKLLRGLADFILATMEILLGRYEFDAIAVSDDYGTQRNMIMSPDMWRQMIKPLLVEIYGLAHKHRRKTFHHSCGHIRPIIGDLIDAGLDILHPIQPEAMDILELKQTFGSSLTFCGGLRTQDLLPYGSPAEVRDEVRRLKDQMGAGGGYVLEPGITIQADVPLKNLLAMIDEAQRR